MIVGIKNERGVGYVVYAHTKAGDFMLRNFGQNQGAAIEFAQWVLDYASDEDIKRYTASYKPDHIYTYPIMRSGKSPILLRNHIEKGDQE